MNERTYFAIDLKSFYASVECVERGLDPLTTNLVVSDASRTDKTICLAVSPSLKSYGIPGRPRLFEVVQKVHEINLKRAWDIPGHELRGSSVQAPELRQDPRLALDYIVAPPRMAHYIACSSRVYEVYLRYVAPEDIHVYSIDEVFIDITPYLNYYHLPPRELLRKIILDVLETTGITATAGIGSNLYLAKIAMDIEAKHLPADAQGVRIAELDEISYREKLWDHRPLTDFWRIGRGYAKKLAANGLFTMGDVARCSLGKPGSHYSEDLLYQLFGVQAELLIDHAWGWEPCTMQAIKDYRPETRSLSSGQVLQRPYSFEEARLVLREMCDLLSLDLLRQTLLTDQLVLTVGYDVENLRDPWRREHYQGPTESDHYGRKVPRAAHGTENLENFTSSSRQLMEAVTRLFERVVDPDLLIRRLNVAANHLLAESEQPQSQHYEQLSFLTDPQEEAARQAREDEVERERAIQKAMLSIKDRYGKNAILRGMNFKEGATARQRNQQIGGHRE